MKKPSIFTFLIGIMLICTSCNKESSLQAQNINSFVQTYFPDVAVLVSIRDGVDYEVTLTDYTKINFDGKIFSNDLEWEEIDCEQSTTYTAVPEALIPNEIKAYVKASHPGLSIVRISRDRRKWDIELSNGIEIEFDSKFSVVEIE